MFFIKIGKSVEVGGKNECLDTFDTLTHNKYGC